MSKDATRAHGRPGEDCRTGVAGFSLCIASGGRPVVVKTTLLPGRKRVFRRLRGLP
jgi:hypothetical protein